MDWKGRVVGAGKVRRGDQWIDSRSSAIEEGKDNEKKKSTRGYKERRFPVKVCRAKGSIVDYSKEIESSNLQKATMLSTSDYVLKGFETKNR